MILKTYKVNVPIAGQAPKLNERKISLFLIKILNSHCLQVKFFFFDNHNSCISNYFGINNCSIRVEKAILKIQAYT